MARRLWLTLPVLVGGALFGALGEIPVAFGGRPDPELMKRSPQFSDGRFRNSAPPVEGVTNGFGNLLRELLFGEQQRKPTGPIPLVAQLPDHQADGLHITWYGHASALIEIEGRRVLVDPVWSLRASPSRLVGPRRLHEP